MQEVVPELILDEERHAGTDQSEEPPRISHRVDRHITDDIGALVVFPHLIT